MRTENNLKILSDENTFFDDYFKNMDLNEDIKKIYEIIDDEELQDEFEIQSRLNKLKNENHKRYYDIDTNKFKGLPEYFDDVVQDILNLYNCIKSDELLNGGIDDAINNKKILDNIYRRISRLNSMVKTYLKEITLENDNNQSRFSVSYFKNLNIEDGLEKQIINKYNELVLYNSVIVLDPYDDLKRQVVRRDYIKEIFKMLNIYQEDKINLEKKDKLNILNEKINIEIQKYKEKIHYLEDLMIENSKYTQEFNNFKNFCNKLIAYDDTSYSNSKQIYETLCDDSKFKILISNFEDLFIKEREDRQAEEKFVYEKFGIKNIKASLNYIAANYMNKLDDENKQIIEYIYDKINSNKYDLDEMNKALGLIVRNIWKETITDVYSYNPDLDFYFICSNNQFIDEKYQTIMISKKELERVDDYLDYQIGFICGYNDNILYITENDDIMTVDYDDMSNLKTPLQVEQEFMNFKVCNRIALNGYITKLEAVYYINNGNVDIYMKAVELANQYKLPLIELKK